MDESHHLSKKNSKGIAGVQSQIFLKIFLSVPLSLFVVIRNKNREEKFNEEQ
jgi:hypothetical protein